MNNYKLRFGIQFTAFCFHAAAVIVVGVIAKGWKVPIISSWNEWIENPAAEDEFAIVTYYQQCFSESQCDGIQVNVKIMVMFFSIISGSHHLFALLFRKWYEDSVIKDGVNYIRWTDYAFSSSLMIVVNAFLLKSPADTATIVATFLVQFMVCLGGAASEYAWAKGFVTGARYIFVSFFLPFILLWALQFYWLGKSAAHSNREEATGDGMPAFVWVYFFVLFAGFCLFPFIHWYKLSYYKGCFEDKEKTSTATSDRETLCINAENKYAAASITAKVPLLLLFSVSLEREKLEFTQASTVSDDTRYNPIGDDTTIFIVTGVSLFVCFIVGIIFTFIDTLEAKFSSWKCCRQSSTKTFSRNQLRYKLLSS